MSTAPRPAARPFVITRHDHSRVDPYYWMMNREDPEVLAHLEAENAFVAQEFAHLAPLEQTLFDEIKSRIQETDTSVPRRRRGWWYFDRTQEGLNYPVSCRVPLTDDLWTPPTIVAGVTLPGEQIILDENLEAQGHEFLSVGILSVSPDDRWVAVGTDTEGNELHHVTVRPLLGDDPLGDELVDVTYGFAWASDSQHFFYTRADEAQRPYQIWRHELGTTSDLDVLIYQEDDVEFNVSVGRSRDGAAIFIGASSSTTSEVMALDAHNPRSEVQTVIPRRHGILSDLDHYTDHHGSGWWLQVTNDEATDFRCLISPVTSLEWRELIAHRPGQRLDGVEPFADFLAISQRRDGYAAVRIVPLDAAAPFDGPLPEGYYVDGGGTPTVGLAGGAEYHTPVVRVVVTSLATPLYVADVVVDTGEQRVLKQQRVLGDFRPEDYLTGRLWVEASDGVRIPVSVVAHASRVRYNAAGDLEPVAPSPFVLYGYGSYEASMDPSFSSIRLSLLDRGVIYAIAHVRGGGEMGRLWYESGRLAQKPTTFSDFVTVARALLAQGWTDPEHFAIRGGSAGGLLMGAVMNLAPELFKCVIADVPFVDVVTTMLDSSLPLTTGEWEEWGNPNLDPIAYRTMLSYSPYDNVTSHNPDGSERIYPHLFAVGGLNDSRVGFWEPAKWVAKIRDAHPDNVAYLKTDMGAGHGGPSGRYAAWRDEAQFMAFLLDELDCTERG